MNIKTISREGISLKFISILIAIFFSSNIITSELHALAPQTASEISLERCKYQIACLVRSGMLVFAEEPQDIAFLEEKNNAKALLLSHGKILIHKSLRNKPEKLLRYITHEQIEAIMQIMEREDRVKYSNLINILLNTKTRLPKQFQIDTDRKDRLIDLRDAFVALFPEESISQITNSVLDDELLANHIIAKAFELISTRDANLLTDPLNDQEAYFLLIVEKIINTNKHNYFTGVFWSQSLREKKIKTALANGISFTQVASKNSNRIKQQNQLQPNELKELLIFDLDGTLYKNEDLHKAYKTALYELTDKKGISREALLAGKEEFGTLRASAVNLGIAAKEIDQNAIEKVKISSFEITPIPNLKETLEKLHSQGYPIALLTNNNRPHSMEILQRLGLRQKLFQIIITASDMDFWKPDWRSFYMICHLAKYDPKMAVSIGDHQKRDIEPASRLGMEGILVKPNNIVRTLDEKFIAHPGGEPTTIAEPGYLPQVELLDKYLKLIGIYAQDRISQRKAYTKTELTALINKRFNLLSEDLSESSEEWKELVAQRNHIMNMMYSNQNFATATRILPWIQDQLPIDNAMEIYLIRDALYFAITKYLLLMAGVTTGTKEWDAYYYSKAQFKTVKDKAGNAVEFYHGLEKITSQAWNGESDKRFSLYAVLEDIVARSVEESTTKEGNEDIDKMYSLMRQYFKEEIESSEELLELSRNIYEDFKKRGYLKKKKIRIVDVCITGTTLLSFKMIIEYFARKEGLNTEIDIFAVGKYLAPHHLGGFNPDSLLKEEKTIEALKKVYDLDVKELVADITNNRTFLAKLIAGKKNMRWGNPVERNNKNGTFSKTPPSEQLVVYARLLNIVNGVIDYAKIKGDIQKGFPDPILCLESQAGCEYSHPELPLSYGLYLVRHNGNYYKIRIVSSKLYPENNGGVRGIYDIFVVKATNYADIPGQENYQGFVCLTFDNDNKLINQEFTINDTRKKRYPWLINRLGEIFEMQSFFTEKPSEPDKRSLNSESETTPDHVFEHIEISESHDANKEELAFTTAMRNIEKSLWFEFSNAADETNTRAASLNKERQSLILYAEDILKTTLVIDLENTVKNILTKHNILNDGKIIIYAKDKRNAIILNKIIEKANPLLETTIITINQLRKQRNEVEETKTLLRLARAKGSKEILAIIRGPVTDSYEVAKTAQNEDVPIIVVGPETAIYSFAHAITYAMYAKQHNGARIGWLIILPPINTISDDIKERYEEYQRSLQALISA